MLPIIPLIASLWIHLFPKIKLAKENPENIQLDDIKLLSNRSFFIGNDMSDEFTDKVIDFLTRLVSMIPDSQFKTLNEIKTYVDVFYKPNFHSYKKINGQKIYLRQPVENLLSDYVLDNSELVQVCLNGLGSHLLVRDNDQYYIDLRLLEQFPVKTGYQRYGGKVLISDSLEIIGIEYFDLDTQDPGSTVLYTPGNPYWPLVKLIFCSSLVVYTTFASHLLECHLTVANQAATSIFSCLSDNNPLKSLMSPFIFLTLRINIATKWYLVGNHALVQLSFGYSWDTLIQIADIFLQNYQYRSFPESLSDRGLSGLTGLDSPYYYGHDGLHLWNIISDFVDQYFDEYQIDMDTPEIESLVGFLDNLFPVKINITDISGLKKWCKIVIFNGSGYHEQVGGNISQYLKYITMFPNIVRRKDYDNPNDLLIINHLPSRKSVDFVLFLAASTFTEVPGLLSDLSMFTLDQRGIEIFKDFQNKLIQFSNQIGLWNETRPSYRVCDPKLLEISVSV
jgi:hypothetical protein